MLWRSLHVRGDTKVREEGHDTPAKLSILLSWRYSLLRDQATGESAIAATRQTGCGCGRDQCSAREPHRLASVMNVPSWSRSYWQHPASKAGALCVDEKLPSHDQTVQVAAWTCGKAKRSTSGRTRRQIPAMPFSSVSPSSHLG
jgi:hypothetical protein